MMVTPEGREIHANMFRSIAQTKAMRDLTVSLRERRQQKKGKSFDEWPVQESTYHEYDATFKDLLANSRFNGSILNFVRGKDEPVIMDLFSFPSALRSILTSLQGKDPAINAFGISAALTDPRENKIKKSDAKLGIVHVTGDLSKVETWRKVKNTLGNKKADLIIERALAGLNYIPHDRVFFLRAMQNIWDSLSPNGGTALVDYSYIRSFFKPMEIDQWCHTIQDQGIDADLRRTKYTGGIRLTRDINSPTTLPRLNTK